MEELTIIYQRLTALETKIETMLSNHLPHLQDQIDGLETKIWAIIMLLVANLAVLAFTAFKKK